MLDYQCNELTQGNNWMNIPSVPVATTTVPQLTPLFGHCQMSLTSIERCIQSSEKLKFENILTNYKMKKLLNCSIN